MGPTCLDPGVCSGGCVSGPAPWLPVYGWGQTLLMRPGRAAGSMRPPKSPCPARSSSLCVHPVACTLPRGGARGGFVVLDAGRQQGSAPTGGPAREASVPELQRVCLHVCVTVSPCHSFSRVPPPSRPWAVACDQVASGSSRWGWRKGLRGRPRPLGQRQPQLLSGPPCPHSPSRD